MDTSSWRLGVSFFDPAESQWIDTAYSAVGPALGCVGAAFREGLLGTPPGLILDLDPIGVQLVSNLSPPRKGSPKK